MGPTKAQVALIFVVMGFLASLSLFAEDLETSRKAPAGAHAQEKGLAYPCPMSFVAKTRTAKTVGKGHVSFSLTPRHIDYDEVMGKDEHYYDLAEGDKNRKLKTVLVAKYGWARHHHIALGIPYLWNDIGVAGRVTNSDGFGNVFLFEKWNCIKEGKYVPAVSADAWYLLPTGNTDRKLGSSHDATKFTAEISKTWRYFSLHLNPGYTFKGGPDVREVNAAVLLTPTKTFWPMAEYNFASFTGGGDSHDIFPGFMWKFFPGACLKLGAVINSHSSMKYRDKVGFAARISYRF